MQDIKEKVAEQSQPEQPKEAKFIPCKTCGYKYCRENANYCTHCGIKLKH